MGLELDATNEFGRMENEKNSRTAVADQKMSLYVITVSYQVK
jgi:hypothetical protein